MVDIVRSMLANYDRGYRATSSRSPAALAMEANRNYLKLQKEVDEQAAGALATESATFPNALTYDMSENRISLDSEIFNRLLRDDPDYQKLIANAINLGGVSEKFKEATDVDENNRPVGTIKNMRLFSIEPIPAIDPKTGNPLKTEENGVNKPVYKTNEAGEELFSVTFNYTHENKKMLGPLTIGRSNSEKDMVEVVPKSFGNKTIDVFMYLIKTGDKGGIMGGIPNYLYYKDIYKKKNPKASEQDAINYAIKRFQKTTKKTQQSQDTQDKDILQLTKSLRPLMMFMTSPKQYQRKINSAIRQLYRKTRGKDSKGSLRENIATFFMYHTLLPVFFHYIGLGLPGLLTNWDDEDRDALGMTSILGVLNSFAILGDMIETARELYEGKPWAADIKSAPPVFTIISSIADNISKYTKAKKEETKSKYLNKLLIELGTFAKIPAGNIKKLYDNYSKVIKGETKDIEENLLRFFNFSDYVIEEKGNKKGKKKSTKLQEILGEPKKTTVIGNKKGKKKSTKLQEILGEPKKTTVIKDAELEEVGELKEVDLKEVTYED